jgi:hypothetical protein
MLTSVQGELQQSRRKKHEYQTLKLDEMNYESMYAKIMPTKEEN